MAKFFPKNQGGERAKLTNIYNIARGNLLLVVIFTLINVVSAAFGSETYFLFTAAIPHYISYLGALLCGKYPSEYYTELGIDAEDLFPESFIIGFIVVAVIITALYFVFWLLSKKHAGWLIAALVCFSLDTIAMIWLYGLAFEMILDVLFHAWVLYYLITGVRAHYKLRALPEEAPATVDDTRFDLPNENNLWGDASTNTENSPTLRRANTEDKSRTFLEVETFGHKITYRRIKRVNELVIDGYVYADIEMLIANVHSLEATIDGHNICVGYNGISSYINVDGETLAKKVRFF